MARVLVSSVACDPKGGSEGAVGWGAVKLLAKQHDLIVLTHAKYKESWRDAIEMGEVPKNLRVEFLGNTQSWHPNRMIARMQSWKWYVEFSGLALTRAKEIVANEKLDLVHQITYATWRVPSSLWRLRKPFVWGPVGGAGEIPDSFLPMLGPGARVLETLRRFQTAMTARSAAFLECIENSAVVLAANDETLQFLGEFRKGKPMLRLPVAYLSPEKVKLFRRPATANPEGDRPLTLFAGGNMEGRKGVALALRALALIRDHGYSFRYTIAGGGPEFPRLKRLAVELGLSGMVEFHPGFRAAEYIGKLHETDVYLLPSFRETTPVTLQEAILAGCYPVVADASAAGEMTRLAGGTVVAAEDPVSFVQALATILLEVFDNRIHLRERASRCVDRVTEAYSARNYETTIEEAYRLALGSSQH